MGKAERGADGSGDSSLVALLRLLGPGGSGGLLQAERNERLPLLATQTAAQVLA